MDPRLHNDHNAAATSSPPFCPELMSEILETAEHHYWGRIQRRLGYDGWDREYLEPLPDGNTIRLRVDFEDPDDETVQMNYTAMRRRWDELWPRILRRTAEMKSEYGYGGTPIRNDSDWFSVTPPSEPIADGAEWSVMLQADEAGWLLDFKGWDDLGGQGVF